MMEVKRLKKRSKFLAILIFLSVIKFYGQETAVESDTLLINSSKVSDSLSLIKAGITYEDTIWSKLNDKITVYYFRGGGKDCITLKINDLFLCKEKEIDFSFYRTHPEFIGSIERVSLTEENNFLLNIRNKQKIFTFKISKNKISAINTIYIEPLVDNDDRDKRVLDKDIISIRLMPYDYKEFIDYLSR